MKFCELFNAKVTIVKKKKKKKKRGIREFIAFPKVFDKKLM